ncbi:MAG TPA: dynamin family protein [Blastocatellia bacterium]|nr:dynamin family protein [Blastocatellia bacterium]
MESPLLELYRYIDGIRAWLEQHAEPLCSNNHAELLQQWSTDLADAEALINQPTEMAIAMLGPSQQGKSTLINALLGQNILAVGGAVGACTCVITSIHHAAIESYQAEIQFIELEEWRRELRQLRDLCAQSETTEDTSLDRDELVLQIETATEKLKAVYPIEKLSDFDFSMAETENCGLPADILPWMTNACPPLQIETRAAQTLRNEVRRYLVGRNQINTDRQYWPLISEVRIYGDFPILANGLVLVDLPGLDDPNPAREQVTQRYLEQARYLWMICNSQTGITRVFTTMLREERLLLRLFLEGRLPEFAVIATRADDFNLAGVIQQMGLDPNNGNHNLNDVLRYRNQEVIKAIREQLQGIATGILQRTGDLQQGMRFLEQIDQIQVFPIASAAYMHDIGLNPLFQGLKLAQSETNIPQLKEYLQRITLERSQQQRLASTAQKLQQLYREIHGFFTERTRDFEALDQRVREQWQRLQQQAQSDVAEKKSGIRRQTDLAQNILIQRCEEFAEEIKRLDRQILTAFLAVFKEWGAINWRTMQAIVKNRGVWQSSASKRRFNLNDDIGSTFLELISVKWDQFFGEHLKQLVEQLGHHHLREIDTLVQRIEGQISMLDRTPEGLAEMLSGNVNVVKDGYGLRSQQAQAALLEYIQVTRREQTAGVFSTVTAFMEPAYQKAKALPGGSGIKQRMLDVLQQQVLNEATHLLLNLRKELLEGVTVLQTAIRQKIEQLGDYATQQVAQVESNLQTSTPVSTNEKELYKTAVSDLPKLGESVTNISTLPIAPRHDHATSALG